MLKLRSLISFVDTGAVPGNLAVCVKSFDFKGYSEQQLHTCYQHHRGIPSDKVAPNRLKEFFLGREMLQEALDLLGCPTPERIPAAPAGNPLGPQGFLVGLSHTRSASEPIAIAVAARESDYLALGVDIESQERIGKTNSVALGNRIVTEAEKEWLSRIADSELYTRRVLQIFSAKEAIYKALWPRYGAPVRFADVSICPSEREGILSLEFNVAIPSIAQIGDRIPIFVLNGPSIFGTLIAIRA